MQNNDQIKFLKFISFQLCDSSLKSLQTKVLNLKKTPYIWYILRIMLIDSNTRDIIRS